MGPYPSQCPIIVDRLDGRGSRAGICGEAGWPAYQRFQCGCNGAPRLRWVFSPMKTPPQALLGVPINTENALKAGQPAMPRDGSRERARATPAKRSQTLFAQQDPLTVLADSLDLRLLCYDFGYGNPFSFSASCAGCSCNILPLCDDFPAGNSAGPVLHAQA